MPNYIYFDKMKITFYIKYSTEYGQSLYIQGLHAFFGEKDGAKAVALTYYNEEYWTFILEADIDQNVDIPYRYFLKEKDGTMIADGDRDRSISMNRDDKELIVYDVWDSRSFAGNVFYADAFQNVLLPSGKVEKAKESAGYTHEFNIKAPLLKKGETVCLIGSSPGLGSWQAGKAITLNKKGDYFSVRLKLDETDWPATYKYGICEKKSGSYLRYEEGENRLLFRKPKEHTKFVFHDGFINEPVNTWKGAGVCVPVFSLRSNKGFGTGEFNDIKLLADWALKTNIQLIQLLPVNDTIANNDWGDSYPYAAISAFALHPLYVNLEKVAGKNRQVLKPHRKKQKQLNELEVVNYPAVLELKLKILHELFDLAKDDLTADNGFNEFKKENAYWLLPYTAWCTLRDQYKTPDFHMWKTGKTYDEKSVARMAKKGNKHHNSVEFYSFVQYHLHLQLKEAVDYAHERGIALKGDLPIGIYRYSCDAWANPELFNTEEQAGAPPDAFAIAGQNWGFPTYKWNKIIADDFAWWKERFAHMNTYFDAFRIDHILGFFRMWSIPVSQVQGIMGRFVPALPIDISDFYYHNIPFDYDRYCLPYITEEVVQKIFGDRAADIRTRFLTDFGDNRYQLKPEVNTQAKVQHALNDKADASLKDGLFQLIANVIMFEEEGSDRKKFHFRFDITSTSSYQHLSDYTKHKLYELYVSYFYERQNEFWKHQGLRKLTPLKNSTNMLVFGENLGMVPPCVPVVMNELAIIGLDVERMPKDSNHEFSDVGAASYLTAVIPSTHDMSTIREWWQEDREKTQKYYNYLLHHYGEAPAKCEPWISEEIISEQLNSPAMWTILQLQDLFEISGDLRRKDPEKERINDPANSDNHWNYRIHIPLETMNKSQEFNNKISAMIIRSGRLPLHVL